MISNTRLSVEQGSDDATIRRGASTIGDLVQGLSALHVDTRRIISILQALKSAGALHAEIAVEQGGRRNAHGIIIGTGPRLVHCHRNPTWWKSGPIHLKCTSDFSLRGTRDAFLTHNPSCVDNSEEMACKDQHFTRLRRVLKCHSSMANRVLIRTDGPDEKK